MKLNIFDKKCIYVTEVWMFILYCTEKTIKLTQKEMCWRVV